MYVYDSMVFKSVRCIYIATQQIVAAISNASSNVHMLMPFTDVSCATEQIAARRNAWGVSLGKEAIPRK